MVDLSLSGFFENFLKKNPIFVDKKALQSNYTPGVIPHRDDLIKQIAGIMAPSLRLERPSNLFIYGKPGTGKTLSIKHIMNQLLETSKDKNIPLEIFYLNCKLKRVADTEYRIIAHLSWCLGQNVPATGLPTDEVYRLFVNILEKEKKLVILILDEIDQLVSRAGDEILYNLTRLNSELKNVDMSIVGISNNLIFADHLDPRIKSSLSEEEVVFPPYNALQLQDILRERAKLAFRDNVIEDGVIEKCAAYAAREHGDARRALDLLRVAGELAERKNKDKLTIDFIDMAEEKIEKDRVLDTVYTQPKQHQLTLYSIIILNNQQNSFFTGDVYELYKNFCFKVGLKPLTQRRVSDIVAELDMVGLINVRVISKGRYGRTREITLGVPTTTVNKIKKILEEVLNL